IGELYKLCSKALKDDLGINVARVEVQGTALTVYFFKHIVKMKITLSGLGLLNKKLNKLI
ncbi:MAG: hypothetical protein RXR51_05775, partial [Nitrososphaeria archaeon]